MAQSVRRQTLAQVMISRFVGLSPALDSVLAVRSLDPALDSVSLSLSLSLSAPPPLTLCPSLSQKEINIKTIKKEIKKNIAAENE